MLRPSGRHHEIFGDLRPARGRCGHRRQRSTSILSLTHLMPTQTPAKRDIANPCTPKSRISCTPAGLSTGHHVVDHREFGLMRRGRAFAGVIVAEQCNHTAVLGRAGMIGVAKHVAGPVDAGPLAVPDAEHAVVFAFASQLRHLRAPQRRRREVFVETGLEHDVVLLAARPPRAGTRLRGRRSASRDSRSRSRRYSDPPPCRACAASASAARWPVCRSAIDASGPDRTCR